MRNYQLKGECELPHNIYMQVQYIIKDYDRLKREKLNILCGSSPPSDGMPRSSDVGNPTEQKALRLASIENELRAIDQACAEMRGITSERTMEAFDPIKAYWSYNYFNYMHIRRGDADMGPSRRTWNRFKSRLSYRIAKNLNLF